ncbi:MAG: GntR family transcriptional regulator [Microbacterium sp.]
MLHGLLRFVRESAAQRTPLLGEVELVERLGCTRQQLRNAMAQLESLGILRRRQGAATTVDPIALRLSVRLEEQYEHSALLDRLGFAAEVDTLDSSVTALPGHVAALMEFPASTRGIRLRKRWRADGRVAMLADDVIPLGGEESYDSADSVFAIAADIWGEPVVWEVTTPGVTVLNETLAGLFDAEPGAPVMTMESVGIGASGRRLTYSFEYHNPDVVSYSLLSTVRPPWGQ